MSVRVSQGLCICYVGLVVWAVWHYALPVALVAGESLAADSVATLPFESRAVANDSDQGPRSGGLSFPSSMERAKRDYESDHIELSTVQPASGAGPVDVLASALPSLVPAHDALAAGTSLNEWGGEPAAPVELPPLVAAYSDPSLNEIATVLPEEARDTLVVETVLNPVLEEAVELRADVAAARAERPTARRYRVQRGDTLRNIAKKEYGRVDDEIVNAIKKANPSIRKNPDRLRIGQQLIMPRLSESGAIASSAG